MIIGQRFFGRARQPALNRVRQLTGSGSRVLAEPCLNQRLSRRLRPPFALRDLVGLCAAFASTYGLGRARRLAEPCLNPRLSRRLRPTLTESGRQDACDPVRYFSQPGRTAGSQLRRARDRISPLTR